MRHEAKEVADADRWLDDTATGETQPVERLLPHGGDDLRAGVVGVSGGRDSCAHLGRLQKLIQLGDFLRPAAGGRTIRVGKRFLGKVRTSS